MWVMKMTKRSVYIATGLFLGGFIPLKGSVENDSSITYQIYANDKKENVLLECNQVKNEMLRIYRQNNVYSFSQVDAFLNASYKQFKLEGVMEVKYQNYCLQLYLDAKENTKCLMKGYLFLSDKEQNLEKSYFFEELFR